MKTRDEWMTFLSTHMFLECVDEILRETLAARESERERCCVAFCGYCHNPATYGMAKHDGKNWIHKGIVLGVLRTCQANAVRRAALQRGGEGATNG